MKREHNILLEALSRINEKYIDEATEMRIRYASGAVVKKRFFSPKKVIALAASFFILISSFLAIMLTRNTKQVPVYVGMSVSSAFPDLNTAESDLSVFEKAPAGLLSSVTAMSAKTALEPLISLKTAEPQDKKDLESALNSHFKTTDGNYDYYANPGEDVYITVHFDNPDNFEILSFTLNGIKYTSYMFEDGSDMENIVLKVNVGDTEEKATYTIDAIKYVDGETIKDVRMDGSRTVDIGIKKNSVPAASLLVNSASYAGIDIALNCSDTEEVLKLSDGKLYAVLIESGKVAASKEIPLGKTDSLIFEEVTLGRIYTVAAVALYDAYDGKGIAAHLLESETVSLDTKIYFDKIRINGSRLTYRLFSYNGISTLVKVEILDKSGSVVSEKLPVGSDELVFDNLLCGQYTLRATYSYNNGKSLVTEYTDSPIINSIAGMLPVNGKITTPYFEEPIFNPTIGESEPHLAVDITPYGDDISVYSLSAGTVLRAGKLGNFGKVVFIKDSLGYVYKYCNLDLISVNVGDTVEAMDVIGTVGDSMLVELAVDDHLHFILTDPDGNNVDPCMKDLPTFGKVTVPYSETPIFNPTLNKKEPHKAVDITPIGSDVWVRSLTDGNVILVENNPITGTTVVIEDSSGYKYYYCSLDAASVSAGSTVQKGEVIGKAGDSMLSELAVPDHVHLYVKDSSNNLIDPGSL